MRVDDAVDIGTMPIDVEMARRIGRRLERTLNLISIEVEHNHVLRTQLFVANPAGLDDDQPALRIARAYIPAGPHDEVVLWQFEMECYELLLEFFQHRLLRLPILLDSSTLKREAASSEAHPRLPSRWAA